MFIVRQCGSVEVWKPGSVKRGSVCGSLAVWNCGSVKCGSLEVWNCGSVKCRGFIKGRKPGKLTGCEQDLAINLPGCFRLLFLLSFIRTKNARLKNPTDLLYKNLTKPLELWKSGSVELWNCGSVNCGSLAVWKYEVWKSGSMELWKCEV